jgi:LL-diaminopimelate aminotransferase
MKINKNYNNLKDSYLFSTIAKKVKQFKEENPNKKVISLGIGDVTLPLVPAVIEAMHDAVDEMSKKETFKGYGNEQGYAFLREAILKYYKETKNVQLELSDIFISDGAKSDVGNILDIFDVDNKVLVPSPVYPVYVDTNIMAGRNIQYMDGTIENNFLPMPNKSIKADIIYLCSPNNPTGAVYTKAQLQEWVYYAIANEAIILFDSAYETFIVDKALPTSIFQIEGAKKCAIEFCSLSKTAGFTGTRCAYTIISSELQREGKEINKLWLRRQCTKFNGVPYIVQKGAEAVFSETGISQIRETIKYYLENAKIIADTLRSLNINFYGGDNSPYIWLECPQGKDSWAFFDLLLNEANIVGTPGAGFGTNGDKFFRLTSFGSREDVLEAMERFKKLVG